MPTNNDAVAALPAATDVDKQLLRNMLFQRIAYVATSAASVLDLVCVDPISGAAIQDILLNGRVYHYDSTDTTSAHDGVSVLVSYEGRRYKLAAGTDVIAYSVIGNTLTTPPVSPGPSIGDAYLVAAAATGAWAGHSDDIAIYTARGWEFVNVDVGRFIYVELGTNADTYYHMNAAGSWVSGFGSQLFAANTVPASALINVGKTSFIVENQTTVTPPVSPTVPNAYIVGASATGVWSGKDGQIAVCEITGTWTYYVPSEGYQVYDKNLKAAYRYTSSAWVLANGAIIGIPVRNFTVSGSTSTGGSGAYTYASGTAPTTAQAYVEDSVTIAYTAAKANARLQFDYQYVAGNGNTGVLALFRDAEANAVAWLPVVHTSGFGNEYTLEILANDAAAHTYKIRLITVGGAQAAPTRRLFTVQEYA